jgi:hypothetical protein
MLIATYSVLYLCAICVWWFRLVWRRPISRIRLHRRKERLMARAQTNYICGSAVAPRTPTSGPPIRQIVIMICVRIFLGFSDGFARRIAEIYFPYSSHTNHTSNVHCPGPPVWPYSAYSDSAIQPIYIIVPIHTKQLTSPPLCCILYCELVGRTSSSSLARLSTALSH